jgi:hypothetical protein
MAETRRTILLTQLRKEIQEADAAYNKAILELWSKWKGCTNPHNMPHDFSISVGTTLCDFQASLRIMTAENAAFLKKDATENGFETVEVDGFLFIRDPILEKEYKNLCAVDVVIGL